MYKFVLVNPVRINKIDGEVESVTCIVLCNKLDAGGELIAKSRMEINITPWQLQDIELTLDAKGVKQYLVKLLTAVHNQTEIDNAKKAAVARNEYIEIAKFIVANDFSVLPITIPDAIIIPEIDTHVSRMKAEVDRLVEPTPIMSAEELDITNTELLQEK